MIRFVIGTLGVADVPNGVSMHDWRMHALRGWGVTVEAGSGMH